MKKLNLSYTKLPDEFVTLLKSNLAVVQSPSQIFNVIRPNPALFRVLENAFREFDDGRGVEKILTGLGWPNFRDRMASLYIYKSIYGDYPLKSSMELVEEIKLMESTYVDHSVHGYSRIFLLGLYLKLSKAGNPDAVEFRVPDEVLQILKLSQGRSEKIDWLVLIISLLISQLGVKIIISSIMSGKKMDDIYALLTPEGRFFMMENLLAYGSSINELDFFLYEKV